MSRQESQTSSDHRPIYSIRFVGPDTSCADCGCRVQGAGPVGHRDGEPLCDLCLFEASADLAMLLALVAVCRTYAAAVATEPEEWLNALRELGAFVRIYERIAAKTGPPRRFPVPGFSGDGAPEAAP